MRLRPLLVLALSTALLTGCATNRRGDALQKALDGYSTALRWDSLVAGEAFIAPKLRSEHPLSKFEIARYAQLRVANYEVQGTLPGTPNTYRQVVRIALINRNTQTVRNITDKQTWRWDAKDKHWWLVSGLPNVTQGDQQGN
ncbi:conserved hypothetical protein, secreted [mine drainage metagenome]|uniref:Lipoprotein n=1 Tax=mine drainage metagenome TaxID=410659 RepID=T0YMR6_9ZZZZ